MCLLPRKALNVSISLYGMLESVLAMWSLSNEIVRFTRKRILRCEPVSASGNKGTNRFSIDSNIEFSHLQDDFQKVLQHSVSSVAKNELERFVKWTQEFGQDG